MKIGDAYRGKLQDAFKSTSVVVLLVGTLLTLILFVWELDEVADHVKLKFERISDSYIAQCKMYLADQKQELSAIKKFWDEAIEKIKVKTPDENFNLMVNVRNQQQLI